MKPIPGESENHQRKHLISDPFLKEYFRLKQEPKDSFQHFRKSFQSQLFQHTRRGKTTKRTCTDQFYALSQQCYEANQNFESKLVVETAKEDEIDTKKSIRTPSLLTRQLSKGKLTPRSNNAKGSPYLATDEDVGLESRGRFRFIHGNVKLLADMLTQNQYQQLHSISNINNHYSIANQPCDLIWSCSHVRSHLLGFLPYYQKINFFPHSYECTRKDSLARNMNTLMQIFGQKHFSFMPECFIWPKEKEQLRQTMRGTGSSSSPLKPTMISRKRQKLQKMRGEFGFETTKPLIPWIVKPSSRSQGKGIFIVTSYEEIETRLHAINEEKESYIVERYINNPLLINGKKFDLRIYVLVTSFDPLKIYIHRDGLVRRASEKYDPSNFSNRFSHLTNYSVNKRHSQWSHSASPLTVEEKPDSHEERKLQRLKSLYEYSMMIDGMKIDFKLDDIPGEIDFLDDASPRRRTHDEYDTEVNSDLEEVDLRTKNSFDGSYLQQEERDGSSYSTVNDSYNENEHKDRFGLKMSFSDLNQWFQENNINVDLIWRKIEDLVIKTLIVTEGKINAAMNVSPINPDCCFELFGFDVLIDNELNPWLMEVNFAPSLSTDSRLDYEVKGQMLLDLLNVIGLKKDFKKESAKNTEGNEKSVLPSTWKVPSSRDETDESSFRNRSSMSFQFKGKFQGQVVPFHQVGGEYKAIFEDELFGNEKAKEEEKMVAESLVQYFYQKDLTNTQDRQILNQFLQEKERCSNSRFQLIFPANSTFPIYAKFFLEQRKFNLVIGRFEFFLLEYEKFLKQHEGRNGLLTPDHTAHHLLRKARSVGASNTGTTKLLQIPVNRQVLPRPRSSSSSNIRLRKEEAKSFNYGILSEEVLTQIHARWAKAMGISTKSF